ncbi:MAG: hypothetical protein J6R00_09130, partial [Lentisphaeria bacterium]|nr:hypothetical protein [Lentisphaeria bacterium]
TRNLIFDNFSAKTDGAVSINVKDIRNIDAIEMIGDSDVKFKPGINLDDVKMWDIEDGASISGLASIDLADDALVLWNVEEMAGYEDLALVDGKSWVIMEADEITGFEDLSIVNGDYMSESLRWNANSNSYTGWFYDVEFELSINEKDGKKQLVLTNNSIA